MINVKKVLNIYNNLSIQKKAVLWFTIATIVQNAILFLVTPIYTRILSDEEYGIFSVYQSWQQIISIISIIALDRCITVGFKKYENEKESFLSSIQFFMTVTVIITIIIFILFKDLFVSFMNLPFYIIIIMAFVSLANNTLVNWSWLQRYTNCYKKLTFVTILSTLFIQTIGIVSVILINDFNKGNVMVVATSAARIIIYGFIYISVFLKGKTFFKKEFWKFSFCYSVTLIPHALAQIILNSSDRIMIGNTCGRELAAYYSVTYSCAMVMNIILTSISSAVQPWFFDKIKNKEYCEIKSKTNIIMLFAALLSIFVCLIAPEIISIMAPSSYSRAIAVFPTVVGGVFFNGMYLYFANFESFYEKPQYFSIATTTGAVINIVLNFLLLPIFGFAAAGYTTLFCYLLFALMHYLFMRKICKDLLSNAKPFDQKFLLILSLVVLLVILIIIFLYKYTIFRYSIIILIFLLLFIYKNKIVNILKSLINKT